MIRIAVRNYGTMHLDRAPSDRVYVLINNRFVAKCAAELQVGDVLQCAGVIVRLEDNSTDSRRIET